MRFVRIGGASGPWLCKTMDYYEELGIPRDATITEIREAYKLAARLLHPDLQREPRLVEFAEREMRRLGDLVSVLISPQERARYDAGLEGVARPRRAMPDGREMLRVGVLHWFWVLLGMLSLGMVVWYGLSPRTGVPGPPAFAARAEVPASPVARREQRPPPENRRANSADTQAARIVHPNRPQAPPAGKYSGPKLSAAVPSPPGTPVEAPKAASRDWSAPAGPGRADSPRVVDESGFAGEWLYAADGPDDVRAGTYPATYVEFRLREESGILAGDYRAVHRLLDKAISPEVVFRVRGMSPPGSTGKLTWESGTGAQGELELTLGTPNQLQVKWWTTKFGRQEALSSGTAVLMRLRAP